MQRKAQIINPFTVQERNIYPSFAHQKHLVKQKHISAKTENKQSTICQRLPDVSYHPNLQSQTITIHR